MELPDFADEYRRYLAEHRHPLNRATHFIGIPLIVASLIAAPLLWDWRVLAVGQGVGWAFQLLGHRIEGNRPALLKRPVSLLIGPLMVLVEMAGLIGIRFRFTEAAEG